MKKQAMTEFPGGGGASKKHTPSRFFVKLKEKSTYSYFGFTLSEVLITLGIIGIVAAMTLPSLIANHRRQVMLTKVKQTYTILNNALERAKVENGTDVNNWYIPTKGSHCIARSVRRMWHFMSCRILHFREEFIKRNCRSWQNLYRWQISKTYVRINAWRIYLFMIECEI